MRTKKVFIRAGLALALAVCSCGTIPAEALEQSIKSELQKKLDTDSKYAEFEMAVQEVNLTRAKSAREPQTEAQGQGWAVWIDRIKLMIFGTARYDGIATVLFDYDEYAVPISAEADISEYQWELKPEAFDFLENAVYIPMLPVDGDKFYMGCTSEQGNDCYNKERPAHIVTVGDFLIGKYPVTQKQWTRVMENNPSEFKGDDLPVENVSWNDAQDFIKKLNSTSGKRYRLPTEAEWEYAARGGIKSEGLKYAGSGSADDAAWYDGNSGETTHPVGTKRPNELDIYDMSGNVWEWVEDRFGEYGNDPKTNPTGPPSGSTRVNRGGSWDSDARYCRTSNRSDNTTESRYSSLGFRVARTPK
jgi:formylglycine-generating enzyme required for sulfatase activity